MSLRLAVAGQAGADESVLGQVDQYETSSLDERWKTALRLADRFVTHPAGVDDRLRAQVFESFTVEEIVEITCDVTAWSKQKVLVALELDPPISAERFTPLHFDRQGHHYVT